MSRSRKTDNHVSCDADLPAIFGSDVFHEATMKRYLEPEVFGAWKACTLENKPLPLTVADPIAEAMKTWAMERGATHYTHWFQPLTGVTAEKHECFISPDSPGKVIMTFSGKALVRGEPDASSFPSGGLRATFEARGYTAWDPTAFAFVKDDSLYIPTCFFSYTGEALDMKTPLLRSIDEVSREAVRILRLFGDKKTCRVIPCVGAEQEYFLIAKSDYVRRTDLRLTNRTLFGAPPPKGQELGAHYFGSIRREVRDFMRDLDRALWRLGILSKTKHNEVAPCQHELAPIYTHANTACDNNQLIMEVMRTTADKHGLVCLLHEKPFAGINGSGKHNNWSLSTDTGNNLFKPGETPSQNAQFLLFLAAFIKGVDEYQDWLRCSVASAGNDHRLGANEAPPAIVSIFLGDELSAVVRSIIDGKDHTDPQKSLMRIGVDVLPAIPKDTTDRNRTSPLAFTGNKFEFRMLGSSQSVSDPNIALNTIMAEELKWFADRLEVSTDFDADLHRVICEVLRAHQRILFSGNGYDKAWKEEAKRRELSSLPSTAECLPAYLSPGNMELVTRRGVFSKAEFLARHEILRESYCKTLRTEALTMTAMIRQQILPAVGSYSAKICETLQRKRSLGLPCQWEYALSEKLSHLSDALDIHCQELELSLQTVPTDKDQSAMYYRQVVLPAMEASRQDADELETLTEKTYWPFPTYSDLLFFA